MNAILIATISFMLAKNATDILINQIRIKKYIFINVLIAE
jgi:hypothetical protein